MAFHDIRLPTDVERGALGGARFKTTILELESGFEQRNIDWSRTRGEWDVGYGLLNVESDFETNVEELRDFFYARQGRANTFRFKDFMDFKIGDPNNPSLDNQLIGLGDGANTVFQIFKRYTSGAVNYDRSINKIVSGTVSVFLNGALQTDGVDYTVDLTTGIITFTVAPGNGIIVSLACEFDNHARFDTDKLDLNVEVASAAAWPNIPIVEVREV